MPIKRLSERSINQIAAGEVVERPISVVKELVENSLDAQAKNIKIELDRGGRNLIRITDDGCGIQDNEIELALERHATSKLDEDNIADIRHLGFRGEALPAIASVSKMLITSRHFESDKAVALEVIGGARKPLMPARREIGTTVEVRDLFCFTPNRLNFLKSEAAETAAAVDLIKKLALANKEVNFTLVANGKTLLHTSSNDLLTRITQLLGQNFSENTKLIKVEQDDLKLFGYIGVPTFNASTSAGLHFYVNNRIVKDKLLNIAVRFSYQDIIPKGRHPVAIIFLELDPFNVDVNVHPTKAEVRFRNENLVRSFIIKAIKENLRSGEIRISSTVSTALAVKKTAVTNPSLNFMQQKMFTPKSTNYAQTAAFSTYEMPTSTKPQLADQIMKNEISANLPKTDSGKLGEAKFQVAGTYIVAESEEGLVIVDQHAAHERLVLEKMKEQLQKGELHSQALIIPHVLQLTEMQTELLIENKQKFAELGLLIEKQGANQIIVRSIPVILGGLDTEKLFADLIENLETGGDAAWLNKPKDEIYANIACHASIRAGRKLSIVEMNAILRQMEATPLAAQCNHGRPTVVFFKEKDLAKIFERI
jgi:DNA mismatch repair protein MutL